MSGWYEVRLEGHLDPRWTEWFDVLSLSAESDGTTVLRSRVTDQAALHGLLQKVRDLGLPLVSVSQIDVTQIDPDLPTAHETINKGD
ncbi:hypothetical protein [Glaciibacter sp. 2TAF33]|uniref:hypothetical protein n=1 Tax=Glaciibacter sp. 2TAF33 TaxID=3233015 RepID=UPI003F9138A4